jgi:hypothetical protein
MSRKPIVLNMRGRKGCVPPGAVYVGRQMRFVGLPQSKWANRYVIGRDGTRAEVIEKYRAWIVEQPELMAALHELCGKDLACWCAPPEPCHADVLLELANAPEG